MLILGAPIGPFVEAPFGVRVSHMDLAFGAFAGGEWSVSRIVTLAIFVADVAAIVALVLWLILRQQRPNPTVETDARKSGARGSP
jgi:quinol-cytochrome oxidoreductase complex cytochrome b subunit